MRLEEKTGLDSVLIVVAHTDDETYGMGGTIAKLSRLGLSVNCMSFTDGVSSRDSIDARSRARRSDAGNLAAKILGFQWARQLDFPDNGLDSVPLLALTQQIEEVAREVRPNFVFTHFHNDLNIDHERVSRACATAFRPVGEHQVNVIRTFEVPSSTELASGLRRAQFTPTFFEQIEEADWYLKINAVEAYAEETRDAPHPRSQRTIEALSILRGSQSGFMRAEGFESQMERGQSEISNRQ